MANAGLSGPEAQLDVQETFNFKAVGSYPTGFTNIHH